MSHDHHNSSEHHNKKQTTTALTVTNVLLGILAAGFAIGFIYMGFVYEPSVDPEVTARYAEEAKERLNKHADVIQQEVTDLASEAIPPISEAIYQQAKEDYPVYLTTLEKQGDVYLQNAEKILIDKVKAQYRDYLRAHRNVLKEEFPEHANEENVEQVIKEFEQTFDKLVERYYIDEFRKEAKQTIAIWKRFEPLEVPKPSEPSLQEQLADYTADWAMIAVAEESEEAVEGSQPQ